MHCTRVRVSHPSNEALPVPCVVEELCLLVGLDHEPVHVHVKVKQPGGGKGGGVVYIGYSGVQDTVGYSAI